MGWLRREGDAPRVVGFDFAALAAARPSPGVAAMPDVVPNGPARPAAAPPPAWVRAARPPADGPRAATNDGLRAATNDGLRPTRRRARPVPGAARAAS